jgi:hypothetical protein
MQKVSPPLLLLEMDFAADVQVKTSIFLRIVEKILSWLGRVATVQHIVVGSRRLVPVSVANMLHSSPM